MLKKRYKPVFMMADVERNNIQVKKPVRYRSYASVEEQKEDETYKYYIYTRRL